MILLVTTIRGNFYSGNYICVDTNESGGSDYAFKDIDTALDYLREIAQNDPKLLEKIELIDLAQEEENKINNLRGLLLSK